MKAQRDTAVGAFPSHRLARVLDMQADVDGLVQAVLDLRAGRVFPITRAKLAAWLRAQDHGFEGPLVELPYHPGPLTDDERQRADAWLHKMFTEIEPLMPAAGNA